MMIRRSCTLVVLTALCLIATGVVVPAAQAVPPGPALAWGLNNRGQLGDGTTTNRSVPVVVCAVGATAPCPVSLDGATAVAAGQVHTLWLLSDGTVAATGSNDVGQLGEGTTTDRGVPVRVCAVGATAPCTAFLSGVTAIAAGSSFSLALLSNGSVVAWGDNFSGQLGDGTTTDRSVPVRVCAMDATAPCTEFLSGVTAIAGGQDHSLAVAGGVAHAWGENFIGQLGDATTTSSSVPVRVCAVGASAPCTAFLSGVTAIAAARLHSVAVVGGVAHTWGANLNGRLGDATTTNSTVPVRVCAMGATAPCTAFLSNITAIATGQDHSLAVVGGVMHTWGQNRDGQLGDATTTDRGVPVRVCAVGATAPCSTFLSGVTAVAGGQGHSVAVVGGVAHAWGRNNSGQLGDATTTNRSVPVRVCAVGATAPCTAFLSGVTAVSGGVLQSVAIGTPPAADLAVALTATAPPLASAITYTLVITNMGPDATTGGTVTLTVPTAATGATSATCTYTQATRTATCPVGALAAGAHTTHTVRASFGLLTNGTLQATATRTSSTPADPHPANDTATATCTAIISLIIRC